MEELGIEDARRQLGEIVNRAHFAEQHTLITRQGKPVAVVVNADWYSAASERPEDRQADAEALAVHRGIADSLNDARRVAGLPARRQPQDKRVVHHIDGDATNNDPSNLELRNVAETTQATQTTEEQHR